MATQDPCPSAFQQVRDYAAAVRLLGDALAATPQGEAGDGQRALLLDLRSGAALAAGQHDQALDDALLCTKLAEEW